MHVAEALAPEAGGDRRPRARRRRRVVLFAAVVLAALVAAGAWLLFGGEAPRPVSVDEAKRRTGDSTTSVEPSGEFGPPAGGVYVYRGEGTETTSFPPLTEQQGPTMPATVTADGPGCWRLRIDYNTHHWQDWGYCADASGIVTSGGQTFARRSFGTFEVDNTSTFTCDPAEPVLWAGMEVGDVKDGSCSGTSTAIAGTTTSSGTITFVGDEELQVAGETVRARHLRVERELAGAQEGDEVIHWWVDPSTMLPIRNEHDITVRTKVGAITVTYTETASYELTSLTPE